MTNPVSCTDCGTPLPADDSPNDPDKRTPCPKCGSKARTVNISVSDKLTITITASGTLTGIPYEETLLATAKALIDSEQPSIATVVVHMACEIAMEEAFSRAFAGRGITDIEDVVEAFLPGYNIANERIRNLYNALTGRRIQSEGFWQAFAESAARRNAMVHGIRIATDAEAKASYAAAQDLLKYLR